MDPITIGGLVFTVATAASLISLQFAKVVVPRVGRWASPPRVLVSESAPVSIDDVVTAVEFWSSRGFEFGAVTKTPMISGPVEGAIFVGPADHAWRDGKVGRATWLVDYPPHEDELEIPEEDLLSAAEDIVELYGDDGFIKHAFVSLDPIAPKWDHVKILTHEFGHALGFLHCEAALLGRRKKDSKNGKRKAGDARLRATSPKSGHAMHPLMSGIGMGRKSTKGMKP